MEIIKVNLHSLMQYVSCHLHTPVVSFDHSWKQSDCFNGRPDFIEPYQLMPEILDYIREIDISSLPVIVCVSPGLIYGMVDTEKEIFVIGPVKTHNPVFLKRNIDNLSVDSAIIDKTPVCTFADFSDLLLLIHNLFSETPASEADLTENNFDIHQMKSQIHQNFSNIIFTNQENIRYHNPYDQEIREQTAIETGNLELFNKSIAEDFIGKYGTLASDPLRNEKNMGIVNITLACRSAMRGGLEPETSYSLSDSYIQKIEECTDCPSCHRLYRAAEYHYASLVHDIQAAKRKLTSDGQHPQVDQCKKYIFNHLHEKIIIPDIAAEIGINANYLSEIFKKYEGVSIGEYIMQEKIKEAKNLLTYSAFSYSDIANYLAYSSQSHLGRQFKANTGMTLKQYRNKYGVKDNIEF